MIHREGRYFCVECDACTDVLKLEISDFYLVPETMKQHGWRTTKESDGTWQHTCPACQAEERNSQNDFTV